jgi:hypothetical protein
MFPGLICALVVIRKSWQLVLLPENQATAEDKDKKGCQFDAPIASLLQVS